MQLSKNDTMYLKGIAILFIAFHNYFHLLPNTAIENEFSFSQYGFVYFIKLIINNPADSIKQLFSFFGHYGVQIFIFLSGYGLSVSLKNDKNMPKYIISKILKVYFLLIIALISLSVFYFLLGISLDKYFLKESILKLLLISNLFKESALSLVGPWWFFSVIIQLYLIFPLLYRINNKNWIFMIIIFSWILQIFISYFYPKYFIYLRYNFIGHIPEFILGIYFAKNKDIVITTKIFLLSVFVFILGFFYKIFWIISFISIPVIFCFLYCRFYPKHNSIVSKIILFIGELSMFIFIFNGFIRLLFLEAGKKSIMNSLVYSLINILFVIILSVFMKILLLSFKSIKQKIQLIKNSQ